MAQAATDHISRLREKDSYGETLLSDFESRYQRQLNRLRPNLETQRVQFPRSSRTAAAGTSTGVVSNWSAVSSMNSVPAAISTTKFITSWAKSSTWRHYESAAICGRSSSELAEKACAPFVFLRYRQKSV